MRGSSGVVHKPYQPAVCPRGEGVPYICRLAPFATGFEAEWIGDETMAHTLFYKRREAKSYASLTVLDRVVRVSGLECDREYEFYIEREDGRRSNTRLVRCGEIPNGTNVINYLHPDDNQYDFSGHFLCSPSLVRLPSGRILASMDVYGKEMPQNLTLLFFSDDEGESWHYLCDLYPFFWGTLFMHRGKLYFLGQTTEYGNLQIIASEDEGEHFSEPVTLFYGSNVLCRYGGCHRAPMHLVSFNGRLWTSMEYGCWRMGSHLPAVLSIREDSDLLVAENWTLSDFLPFEGEWRERAGTQGDTIEGNLTVIDGKLYNLMRWRGGEILKLCVDAEKPESAPIFSEILEAPVSNSMFRVLSHGDGFLLVSNPITERQRVTPCWSYRSILSIYKTKDFNAFTHLCDVVNCEEEDPTKTGFQYPAFLLEGNTLSLAIRSAFNSADTFHNSNYILFYRTEIEL